MRCGGSLREMSRLAGEGVLAGRGTSEMSLTENGRLGPMEAMAGWQERINIDPDIMGGKPVIKGTRVPVETIVGALSGGSTIAELVDDYGITEDDVRAALAFATDVLSHERLYALPHR